MNSRNSLHTNSNFYLKNWGKVKLLEKGKVERGWLGAQKAK